MRSTSPSPTPRIRTARDRCPSTLQAVDVGERSLNSYRGLAPASILEAAALHAEALRGALVLHLNATPCGGGVSELLRSLVPLLNDLGIAAEWRVTSGDEAFFRVTKGLHNRLQGAERELTEAEWDIYRETTIRNALELEDGYDFVFVHDPQPAAIRSFGRKDRGCWIWRCHRYRYPEQRGVVRLSPVPRWLRRGHLHDARV